MDLMEIVKSRRSIRKFKTKPIPDDMVDKILDAGRWAPSGLNNQPWRFVVVQDKETVIKISENTKYKKIIMGAPLLIVIFLDNNAGYNHTKDVQAIGACIQNMLLMCRSLELGCCWMGEILNRRQEVEKLLEVPQAYELMAVLAIGYPDESGSSSRKELNELIFKKI